MGTELTRKGLTQLVSRTFFEADRLNFSCSNRPLIVVHLNYRAQSSISFRSCACLHLYGVVPVRELGSKKPAESTSTCTPFCSCSCFIATIDFTSLLLRLNCY